MKLTSHPVLSAARFVVAAVLLSTTAFGAAQAASELSLKGTSTATRYAGDAELRLSLLGYNDAESAEAFVSRFDDYLKKSDEEPEAKFDEFLRQQETRGYLFTQEATGYTIKYAWKDPVADGKRMVFVVSPALKTLNPYMWEEANEDAAPFSVLELRRDESESWILKTNLDTPAEVAAEGFVLQLKDFAGAETFATLKDNTPYYLKGSS